MKEIILYVEKTYQKIRYYLGTVLRTVLKELHFQTVVLLRNVVIILTVAAIISILLYKVI